MYHNPSPGNVAKLLAASLLAIAPLVSSRGAAAADLPKASCSTQERPAVIDMSYAPVYPAIAVAVGMHGSTLVRIHLSSSGNVESATVARSSGFAALDEEAVASARLTSYKPEAIDCRPVEGDYLVEESFA